VRAATHSSKARKTARTVGAYEEAIVRVQRALGDADLPSGWLPEGPDDPALLELFTSYWTARPTSPDARGSRVR